MLPQLIYRVALSRLIMIAILILTASSGPANAHDIPYAGELPLPTGGQWASDCIDGEVPNLNTHEGALWSGAKLGACGGYLYGVMTYFTSVSLVGSNAHEGPFFCHQVNSHKLGWLDFLQGQNSLLPDLYAEDGLVHSMDPEVSAVSQIALHYLGTYPCASPATVLPMPMSEYADSCRLVLSGHHIVPEDFIAAYGRPPEKASLIASYVRHFCVSFLTGIVDARGFHLFAWGDELKSDPDELSKAFAQFRCFTETEEMDLFAEMQVLTTLEKEAETGTFVMNAVAPTIVSFLEQRGTSEC